MVGVVANTVPDDQLEAWLEARDFGSIIGAFEQAVAESISFSTAQDLRSTYATAVTRSARATGLQFGLALTSQLVVDSIMTDANRVIVGVGQDTIDSVHRILTSGYLDGIGTSAMSRIIRDSVGLLPSHADAAGRYARTLLSQRIPTPEVARLTAIYQNRLRSYRAENIARTETMAAAHAGQLEAFLQMANQGSIDRNRARLVWVVTEDDRLCPWCAPMDGQEIELGQMFVATHKGFPEGKPDYEGKGAARLRPVPLQPDPRSRPRDRFGRFISKRDSRDYLDGKLVEITPIAVPHPPLHPQCRCTMNLRFDT